MSRCNLVKAAMETSVVLIGIPGSPLVDEVAACLSGTVISCRTLSIDAPLEGKPVTVAPGSVFWEGIDLLEGGAILVERPVFLWPQMQLPTERFHMDFTHKQWVIFQREARSLAASALLTAAEYRHVMNPPAAADLAASPSIALDRIARAGMRVHPWNLEPAPSPDRSGSGIVIDACGRDRWHSPQRPQTGEPALVLEPFSGEVATFIVVGGTSAGALRYSSSRSWVKSGMPEPLDDPESLPEAAQLAVRVAAVLGLDISAVSIRTGVSPHSVLLCEAGPDLAAWNQVLGGRLAAALADHLVSVASK